MYSVRDHAMVLLLASRNRSLVLVTMFLLVSVWSFGYLCGKDGDRALAELTQTIQEIKAEQERRTELVYGQYQTDHHASH